MDLNAVREEAIEATTRTFWDRYGTVPDPDSDEWEEEYRRQFEQVRKRHATGQMTAAVKPAAAHAAPPPDEPGWAELTGAPTQIRWAASLRNDRLKEIKDPGIHHWLATTWTKAKSWIDTQNLPTPVFLQRIQPHYAEYRRQAEERAKALEAERQAKETAAAALRHEIEAAGITIEGLIELVDIAERLPPMPIKDKLAELEHDGRNLRIFETGDPAVLMVLEKAGSERSEYGIERDEGLVADLRLFARARELL
jgi:signal transduction histidine kinase